MALPSSVVSLRPPTVSTGPQGACVPGIHFGYQRVSGPGTQAIRRLVWSSRRGRSRASTSIRSTDSAARAVVSNTQEPVSQHTNMSRAANRILPQDPQDGIAETLETAVIRIDDKASSDWIYRSGRATRLPGGSWE